MPVSSRTCDIDNFAVTLEDMLKEVDSSVVNAADKAVAQSIRKGAKTVQSHASKGGLHKWSGEYVGGFSSHLNRSGRTPEGEIGNKAKPGLVHLLEKGHATLTGRRTRAYPHMAPAFDEIQKDFIDRMEKEIGSAL